MWMGSNGSTAELHYDTSDNLYVPLHGHKVFALLPPRALKDVELWSSLHPHYRQSRVRVVWGGKG
jgi:hypothetical protein